MLATASITMEQVKKMRDMPTIKETLSKLINESAQLNDELDTLLNEKEVLQGQVLQFLHEAKYQEFI
jgi:predicted  nucleic acid-binding Zn-ribbon protein